MLQSSLRVGVELLYISVCDWGIGRSSLEHVVSLLVPTLTKYLIYYEHKFSYIKVNPDATI